MHSILSKFPQTRLNTNVSHAYLIWEFVKIYTTGCMKRYSIWYNIQLTCGVLRMLCCTDKIHQQEKMPDWQTWQMESHWIFVSMCRLENTTSLICAVELLRSLEQGNIMIPLIHCIAGPYASAQNFFHSENYTSLRGQTRRWTRELISSVLACLQSYVRQPIL